MCFTFYEEYGLEQEWQVLDIRAVEMIDAAKAQIHGREEGGGAEADECPGAVSLYICAVIFILRRKNHANMRCVDIAPSFSGLHSSYLA
jgi:hypothetical protein